MQIVFSDIVIVANVSNTTVNFEDDLVINASLSFDPDFVNSTTGVANTSVLSYQYLCNNQTCDLNAT